MIGRKVGNFRILRKVGEGGMGAVYHAIDEMVDRDVAIKVLRPEIARQPGTLERFRTEAVTLARLNDSNIATLYTFLLEDDQHFMVIEFVKGRSLEEIIRERGALPLDTALNIIAGVLDGLKHAHLMGVLHRDIKPANILITESGGIKVTDFGIARFLSAERTTRDGRIIGTLEYMAPERILGKEADVRSDLYSVGVVLFEMLTGRLPFRGENEFELLKKQLDEPPPRFAALGVHIPEPIEQIVRTAMAKKPEQRPESALLFREDVTPYLPPPTRRPSRELPKQQDPTPVPVPRKEYFKTWKYAVAGALGMVILIGALLMLLTSNGPAPTATNILAEEPVPPQMEKSPAPPAPGTVAVETAQEPAIDKRTKALDALNQ